jgi:beta-galactosidase
MIQIRGSAALACLAVLLPVALNGAGGVATVRIQPERRQAFNDGWRFWKGDAQGAEAPGFQDAGWREVRLPHDWAIEGPFDAKFNPHTGGLPISGTGWYRKSFTVPDALKGKHFSVEFDGAMSNARVWLNGKELGGRPYGYIGFAVDLTTDLRFGGAPNVLAVRLTPEDRSSRWYPGAGIYRNVWLDVTAPRHVAHWGVYVTTPVVTDETASVEVRTSVRKGSNAVSAVSIRTTVLDAAGKAVARSTSAATIATTSEAMVAATLSVPRPQRWQLERPYLSAHVTEVLDGDRVIDRQTTPFGIRTIALRQAEGFSAERQRHEATRRVSAP